ncbi:sulfatase-like hydrolase/transferase [Rubripirellula sp.]|jgi:arylsulfatase A|nr:sulfatase-like hydrolase/transferase [Rubripirellula sp.]MDB4749702.1 sulfatase-like hydrolase/transferase [Rubripirellula sp.]
MRFVSFLLMILFLTNIVKAGRPNVIVVLADDLGFGDVGCYGNDSILTPRIDRFATEGLRLTSCYAAHPNCSPSRAGLMTGRTPFRLGIYNWIPMFSPMHVKESELTIATLLRNAGYETCHVGKWHLNGRFNLPGQPQPNDHGFDHWFATQNNALPNHRNPENFVRNGKDVGLLPGYSAEIVADEAIQWLSDRRDPAMPFFLFACFHEPHEPIASAAKYQQLYPHEDPAYSAHHGNISQLDAGFGRLLDALKKLDLQDDTVVIFTSDNGPAITAIHPHGSAGGLRDKKGTVYEGGIRVPGMVRWPGKIKAGTESDVPISALDLLPTLCDIGEAPLPNERELDGASLMPLLKGEPLKRKKPLYWQFNRAKGAAKVAVREGKWKLLASITEPGPATGADLTRGEMQGIKNARLKDFELYDLHADPQESVDRSGLEPVVLNRLKKQMQAMYGSVQKEGPVWPDWEWPRHESSRIVWPDYWLNRKRK